MTSLSGAKERSGSSRSRKYGDPSLSLLLHDKLQVPNSSRRAWNERDSRCDVCATHLTQLKQEAVRLVLSLDQWDLSPTSSPPALIGRSSGGPAFFPSSVSSAAGSSHPSFASCQSPSPSPNHTPTPSPIHGRSCSPPVGLNSPGLGNRLGSKPSSLGLSGGERRSASPSLGKAGGLQQQQSGVNSSGSNGGNSSNNGSSAAPQSHQILNRNNGGVTLYPYQISQVISEASREDGSENGSNTSSPSHTSSSPHKNSPSHTSTSAAASFFARAAQKLNLTSKKKKQKTAAAAVPVTTLASCDPHIFPTNFSSALLMAPPPAPPCLLRAANKIKDTPGLGKVKVMVRVCPVSQSDESSSFLKVNPSKKQITIMDPSTNQSASSSSQKRPSANQVPPKMFTFDAAFPPDASQAEVCAGTVAEVIQSVVNGADGCVFCFGHSKLGKSHTMIGRDDSLQTLGIIPCAISWLFKLINERKEKTGARFSVRVSAVEVWGKEENLKDLLSEVATGSLQDGQSPGVYLCEDPICGMQLQNQSELRAPTPEKAAWFLDAALAARHSSQRPDTSEEEHRNSHMLFTLHIYQYRMEKTGKGGMSGGRSRLHLLDLGSCDARVLEGGGGKPRENLASSATLCLSLSALGNVILALVNGSKHIPYKDSKLTMLLRESLGNMNCRTTMIAHISASPRDFSETLSTIQIASRVLRMKKKKTKVTVQYTSSSSGGESSCEEGRMRRPTHLRAFHHRGDTDSDLPLLRLSSDQDEYSSSEQSCDTVIYVGPNGAAVSDRELTDNEGPPEFVPIIPALLHGKTLEQQNQTVGAVNKSESQEQPSAPSHPQCGQSHLGQPLPPVPEEGAECLKCNTFAELQERLDCIDGSEEVAKFPFEEVPVNRQGVKYEACPASAVPNPTVSSPRTDTGKDSACISLSKTNHCDMYDIIFSFTSVGSKRRTNDQQLQDIKEVVEEAELAQTMIHSLTQRSGSPIVTCTRSVPGSSSSSSTSNPLLRAKSSQLHDSRENLNGGCNGEGKTRTVGSPRLGIASLTKTAEYRPPSSPSQRCKVYTQKCVMPTTPLCPPTHWPKTARPQRLRSQTVNSLAADSGRSSTDSVLSRTSPVGMSPQVKETAPSLSASLGSAETLCDDDVPPIPLDMHRDGSSPTADAQVHNAEACLGLTAITTSESQKNGPSSIVSFTSDGGSLTGTVSQEFDGAMQEYNVPFTTTGVTEIVAMAEVAMAKLRVEGEALATVMSSCASPMSSWMSDLSMCSEADQSLHSFSQSQSQQGEAMAENEENVPLGPDELGQPENGSNTQTPTKSKLRKLPPPMNKTTIQTLVGPFKATISVHPCVAVKPMVIKEPSVLSSPVKGSLIKEPIKCSTPLSGSVSNEMSFEDPWLKRGFEEGTSNELVCEVKPEKREGARSQVNQSPEGQNEGRVYVKMNTFGSEVVLSPDSIKRVVDGCEIMAVVAQGDCLTTVYNPDIHQTASLPRGWHRINRHDGLDYTERNPSSTTSTQIQSGSEEPSCQPTSPTWDCFPGRSMCFSWSCKTARASIDSSRLFSAKLEQLASRTNSLGRTGSHSGSYHYDCFSLERGESLRAGAKGDSVLCRTGRSLIRTGSMSSPSNTSQGFTPIMGTSSAPQSPAKTSSQSKISAVSKLLMTSPKGRSLSTSSTKTLSFSTKSLSQSNSRSSSLPPNGKSPNAPVSGSVQQQSPALGSWSTQSLSRSRGGSLAAKLPLRAVNGRISELLQGSTGSRSRTQAQGGSPEPTEDKTSPGSNGTTVTAGPPAEERLSGVQTLPSPYSKVTAPENHIAAAVAMPVTTDSTVLPQRGSSGYESMLRDSSENTGSTSSAQDSLSDHSTATSSSRRSSKSSKKSRSNTGLQRRRLIPALTLDPASLSPSHRSSKQAITSSSSSSSSPGACWVDGPLGPQASTNHRIKVYEIDDVERLQKRRDRGGSKEGVYVSAKLKKLENRQQRISEVRAKYQCLKKELEQTKQHLMLEPHKWTTEFELQQVYEVDSLEYLQELEIVTGRLESTVNFCKAHLMMVTCFDVSSKHR
ncbi:hypothetical protein WMY93_013559 [Mugilogobius chulae]|uniref:Kinesin motor domain-containing protein n=1 Tax=Mugilogobius chulae TaxID=88201 RepID=A0AAW0P0C4_9GOBI